MNLYEGTKRLRAKLMSRGDYNAYRGWTVPENEDPADVGYLVEYEDGGKPNDPRHAGYISWSPLDVFERSYKPVKHVNLPPHLQRMAAEAEQLHERTKKLGDFLQSATFATLDSAEQERMRKQRTAMREYSTILDERLAAALL